MCEDGEGREKEVGWGLRRLRELYEALETNQLPKLPNDPKLLSIAYSSTHVVALYEFTLRTFTISSNEITQSSITPIPSARKYTHIHSVQKSLFSLSTLTNTILFDAHKGTFYTGKDGGWAGDYCGTAREIIDTLKREWIHVGKGDRLWTLTEHMGRIDVREDKIEGISKDLTLDANVNISLYAFRDVSPSKTGERQDYYSLDNTLSNIYLTEEMKDRIDGISTNPYRNIKSPPIFSSSPSNGIQPSIFHAQWQ